MCALIKALGPERMQGRGIGGKPGCWGAPREGAVGSWAWTGGVLLGGRGGSLLQIRPLRGGKGVLQRPTVQRKEEEGEVQAWGRRAWGGWQPRLGDAPETCRD